MTESLLTSKAKVKKTIYYDLGCDADDWLYAAKYRQCEFKGAKAAVSEAVKNIQSIIGLVDKDLDEGKLELDPIGVAKYTKLMMSKAVDSLINQVRHLSNCEISIGGEMSAYGKLIDHLKRLHEKESSVVKKVEAALKSGEVNIENDGTLTQVAQTSRMTGVRPMQSIAAQRRMETTKVKNKRIIKCGYCREQGHSVRRCGKINNG